MIAVFHPLHDLGLAGWSGVAEFFHALVGGLGCRRQALRVTRLSGAARSDPAGPNRAFVNEWFVLVMMGGHSIDRMPRNGLPLYLFAQ